MLRVADAGAGGGAAGVGRGVWDHVLVGRIDVARLNSIDAFWLGQAGRGTGPMTPHLHPGRVAARARSARATSPRTTTRAGVDPVEIVQGLIDGVVT
jgi:hypothetical protein